MQSGEGAPTTSRASATGTRLSAALLGYFALITLVITLSPFDFRWPSVVRLSTRMVPSDIVANVALFLPLGFLAHGLLGSRASTPRLVTGMAAACSVVIELAQVFIRKRYVSPVDVVVNTYGAYLGSLLRARLERAAAWQPGLVGRLGLDIPLVGLAYLLVPQVWLSLVGVLDDPRRGLNTLLLTVIGLGLLATVYEHHWRRDRPRTERRYETDALKRFIPALLAYLVAASLWPLFRPVVAWHGAIGFIDRLDNASVTRLLMLLEQVGGFTVLGYALAEWRGRRELSLLDDLPGITVLAAAMALGLELAQARLAGPGASAFRAALATAGAVYGVAVYHLARAHVRALRPDARTSPVRIDARAA